jgi:phosphoenolpyruvate synthase/pyruvate phosphate dikinase
MLWQLGGKGANLAEMASIGLSVPPGFTITTDTCHEYNQNGNKLPEGLWEEVMEAFRTLEEDMGASLGDPLKPLLVSVRSGAAVRRISFCALDSRFFSLVRIISLILRFPYWREAWTHPTLMKQFFS